ncbi:50S ribosomal protein L6 [bacterium]|jgi:large subunit ribosomal protein L6|nr:50S ribosomal protein L6 [bacterium]
MSKIGRMPIPFSSATVSVDGQVVSVKGVKGSFTHELPSFITVGLEEKVLKLTIQEDSRNNRMHWGLHRALLANKVRGAEVGFERRMKIVGLGLKVLAAGKKLTFSLGFSHKINYELPQGVDIEVDKTGQNLVLKSADKLMLGNACDAIRSFRPPEPYKGTGIMYEDEVIIRKEGKTKA